jgi:hypothetical protein
MFPLDSKYEIAMVLMSFADFARIEGDHARALHLYSAAKNAYNSVGAWTMDDELKFENNLVICRAALDGSAFAAAVEQGRAMTMEQAIAHALGNIE